MSATPEPAHLNNHHRDTLQQIFQHPTSHNIEWPAVLSLLEAVGTVERATTGNTSSTSAARPKCSHGRSTRTSTSSWSSTSAAC